MAATSVLTGLRLSREVVKQVIQGVQGMRESSTYQLILDEGREEGRRQGRLEEAQKTLVRLGTKCFGPPSEAETNTLATISDLERLERMLDRLVPPANWRALLYTP
jgi:predicted transposase YdaD